MIRLKKRSSLVDDLSFRRMSHTGCPKKRNLEPERKLQMGQTLTKNKRKPKFESREEYFIKNGGILLEKKFALSRGQHMVAGQLKIFSNEVIEKATNYYDTDLILGSSNLRTVYKGTLEGRFVAVKAPQLLDPHPGLLHHHLTEASMSMVMNHENVVKLYGCCLETSIPTLVHEYFPNGSLFEHLHMDTASSKHMQWADRLRVATETGYALSYMHTALSNPVVRHPQKDGLLKEF
ncbi:wall-associated receptor kinase-like 10 [Spinacia oleracea]|uniref:Wall-associated receptor kinase-like 10 n=1 Tax=Spinacia oleracea TaxID=3562 RepID=A0ABM3QI93_SPIOL|nr:wall-associated receptor kinase-like 10 [Spinacia oleracea]